MFQEYPKLIIANGKEMVVFSREEEDAETLPQDNPAEKKKRGRPAKVKNADELL